MGHETQLADNAPLRRLRRAFESLCQLDLQQLREFSAPGNKPELRILPGNQESVSSACRLFVWSAGSGITGGLGERIDRRGARLAGRSDMQGQKHGARQGIGDGGAVVEAGRGVARSRHHHAQALALELAPKGLRQCGDHVLLHHAVLPTRPAVRASVRRVEDHDPERGPRGGRLRNGCLWNRCLRRRRLRGRGWLLRPRQQRRREKEYRRNGGPGCADSVSHGVENTRNGVRRSAVWFRRQAENER